METYFWVASSSSDCNASSAASSSSPSAALDESSSSSPGAADCALALAFPLMAGGLAGRGGLSTLEETVVRDASCREEGGFASLSDFDATFSSSESTTRLFFV